MKKVKTLLTSGATAAAIALSAAPAMAELEASAAVSNIYVFRGVDQGFGTGAVSGDLVYSTAGFYAGIWASSALSGGGEVNFFGGWSGEVGGLGLDLGALSYYYAGNSQLDGGNDLTEAYLGLSFGGAELYYFDNVSGNNAFNALSDDGFTYTTLSYTMGKFSALVGMADGEEEENAKHDNDYVHLDLTYAFNDNLSFAVSKIVDADDELLGKKATVGSTAKGLNYTLDDDALFIVTYSIPLN
ncbi:TorF family putative porin [Litorivivens sp.]|uniref:TorF family putative porin n=1 Tax=Litorivivens sp. TaxID=2020868 RepID=UPI003562652A